MALAAANVQKLMISCKHTSIAFLVKVVVSPVDLVVADCLL